LKLFRIKYGRQDLKIAGLVVDILRHHGFRTAV